MWNKVVKLYKNYKELEYLAYHDSLTGLLNRNWFNKNIDQIKTKYVYFIDINNLHKVNMYGHTFGDEYIKKAISIIKHNGTLIRYAGDEFILFSNFKGEVDTNDYFSVGISETGNCLMSSIHIADTEMLKAKSIWKSKSSK